MKAITDSQAELLEAMKRGVRVFYMAGLNAYCYRTDTHQRVTREIYGLSQRGLVETCERKVWGCRYEVRQAAIRAGEARG